MGLLQVRCGSCVRCYVKKMMSLDGWIMFRAGNSGIMNPPVHPNIHVQCVSAQVIVRHSTTPTISRNNCIFILQRKCCLLKFLETAVVYKIVPWTRSMSTAYWLKVPINVGDARREMGWKEKRPNNYGSKGSQMWKVRPVLPCCCFTGHHCFANILQTCLPLLSALRVSLMRCVQSLSAHWGLRWEPRGEVQAAIYQWNIAKQPSIFK